MDYIEIELNFEEVHPWQDIATALLAEIDFESFVNTDTGLKAYIPKNLFTGTEKIEHYLKDNISVPFQLKEQFYQDQNWNAAWEENFDPIYIQDQLEIIAPFHDSKKLVHTIVINPQMSFGTGHHETTRLIATYMLDSDLKDKKVLDMGTGTGVLAVLAEQKNASDILAVDIEEWAFNNAKENISLNGCKNIRIEKGDIDIINEDEHFDVIIANINKNVLLNHLPSYSKLIKQNGTLYLSGFFHSDIDDLVTKAQKCGFNFDKELNENTWSALRLVKN